ncbi:MAG: AAA family ATPase [Prevotella sp.]|nr:AAA family ATPase [Prevotella sp.]
MGKEEKTLYHEEFAKFVDSCIISDKTLLTTTEELFTKDNLEDTKNFLKAIKPRFDIKNEEARKQNKQAKKKIVKTWGIGDIFDGGVFSEFFKDVKNNEIKQIVIEVLLHCNWLMYLCSDRQHRQASNLYKKDTDKYFKVNTEWAIGPTFSGTSLDAMLFIVELILKVKENTENKNITDNIKKIENLCNDDEWKKDLKWNDQDHKSTISTEAIVNIILFFCDNDKYLSIPAQNKKKLISDKLKGLLGKNDTNETDENEELAVMSDIDQTLFRIRKNLRSLKIMDKENKELYQESNPFWHNTIRPFWDDSTEKLDKEQLSDKTLLEYKKAMILYGPPGTSKSYQARKMAEGMIAEALRNNSANISEAISSLQETLDNHIHVLQMHPNYTYDDFIIGKSIDNGKIVVKSGKLLQIIKSIKKEDKIPHFVILDEINRVDISRVFGELFTAMEASYRDKGVELSVNVNDIPEVEKDSLDIKDGKLYLKVPQNLYFIGTMNMIDFSLEQVDFALRRRFLWRLSTYDADRLDEIISEKVKDNNISEGISDDFSKTCTDLNNEIEWESSLGKSYLIGHAFFAEIVDIFKQVKDWGKAKNILWQVSILPTLEAYCGTMDANMQETFLTRCKDAFMPELKEDKKKKK